MSQAAEQTGGGRSQRLPSIDVARGVAIVAMVIYHAAYDLSAQRLIATDVPSSLGWTIFARSIAGSFLFLVGVGLVLATANGIRWQQYLRRLSMIAGGAALVTIGTWWFEPGSFVFFGILHLIAVASVLALPFLRWPSFVVGAVAAVIIALPFVFRSPLFDAWPLWWLGLQTMPMVSVDYVPLFPWFGVVLAGILGGRAVQANREIIAAWQPTAAPARWLATAGRWSLVIYLVHQPILVGAVSAASALLPPNPAVEQAHFLNQCRAVCERDAATCEAFCGCMFGRLWGTDLYAITTFDEMTPEQRDRFDGLFAQCLPAAP